MAILRADNRSLTQGQKYTYTDRNYQSGVTAILVTSSVGFSANDFVLFGSFGSETAEIKKISSINTSTHELTLTAATGFSHPESTRVTILPYNQVKFYHTSTDTFSSSSQVGSTQDVQADDYFTKITDTSNSTGYGWFVFYNQHSSTTSTNSNAIPYAGFDPSQVERILRMFYSELNNNEQRLISEQDALDWLSEAYTKTRAALNLVNKEYGASSTTITTAASTAEYALPTGFNDVISLFDTDSNTEIEHISIENIDDYGAQPGNTTKYYLRGNYIGFSPTPTSVVDYTLRYSSLPTEITSIYSTIALPDNAFYCLRDYMLFRAGMKIARIDSKAHFDLYTAGVAEMKVTAHKRDGRIDAFEMGPTTNV